VGVIDPDNISAGLIRLNILGVSDPSNHIFISGSDPSKADFQGSDSSQQHSQRVSSVPTTFSAGLVRPKNILTWSDPSQQHSQLV
jgi:hypothetical protein